MSSKGQTWNHGYRLIIEKINKFTGKKKKEKKIFVILTSLEV